MKTIRITAWFFTLSAVLSAAVCAGFLVWDIVSESESRLWLITALPAAVLFLILAKIVRSRQKIAGLIVENEIFHVRPAEFINADGTGDGGLDVYVSCFGILAGGKIFRFNLKDKRLKSIEIGRDTIRVSYGTKEATIRARILHGYMDAADLARVAERFRFETGVEPTILD